MKPAFVFSGQGAQAVGMGQDLGAGSSAAAGVFAEADRVLGWSVSDVCFNGPDEKLTETRYCQPGIYTMSLAALAAFREKFGEITPVGCAGLSLGEFSALTAAGALSFAEGVQLVAGRGELMDRACKETSGAMASVIGGDPDVIRAVCEQCDIDVANYNNPGQIVISGTEAGVRQAVSILEGKGCRKVVPLKVAGAYHSRLMAGAGERLRDVLSTISLSAPNVPVAQNFTGSIVSDPEQIRENLVSQVAGSVHWEECVRALIAEGADTFIEFGPGSVLTGLVRRIEKGLALHNIGTMADLDGFAR